MAGQEINGSIRSPSCRIIHIVRTCDSCNCGSCHPRISLEKASHIIAVSAVPFGPPAERRKISHLIQTACIPCLCNQFDLSQNGITGDFMQNRRFCHRCAVPVSGQNRSKIEPETIYPIFRHPETQTVDNKTSCNRMVAV